jgi:hypothetical protein
MRLALATAVSVALLAVAPAAQAAPRYASPGGSGTECSAGSPCSLEEAVKKAKSGDEVIVTAGAYSLPAPTSPPVESTNVSIHGELGGPMPTISGSFLGPAIFSTSAGARLSYLDITNTAKFGGATACGNGGSIDRMRAASLGDNVATVQQIGTCAVRDTVIRAAGKESAALQSSSSAEGSTTALARNVTAIATGEDSIAVLAAFNGLLTPGSFTLDVKNVIASGAGSDLTAASAGQGPGKIVVSNSNFDVATPNGESTITDAGGNQSAPPLFVNAGAGDFREAAGSPTIDAGTADQIGPLDFDGNPRALGAAPDIGAFEFVPLPAAGQIQSLAVAPKAFRSASAGAAITSARKKRKAPVGARVNYSLSAAATTQFKVERKTTGRRVKGKCRKQTKANRTKKKCPLYRPLKPGFTHSGPAGQNKFKFSGRLGGKRLKPGAYRLVGTAGGATRRASFKIVK